MAKTDSATTTESVTATHRYVEDELKRRLCEIERHLNCDAITCIFPIRQPFDDFIRDWIEDIKDKSQSLLVILETDGGHIETAERIADVLRYHYANSVSFLVPSFAMSAGTVLVMSGDRIYMDYYSVLGPIDPQIRNREGVFVPALGYLEKYNELLKKSASPKGLSQGELAILLQKFDPANLHRFEQARDHSVDLLKKWLVQYKFKDWKRTRTQGKRVTMAMRSARAKDIAKKLNETKKWRSHARGLSMAVLDRELKLLIEDFGKDPELNSRVRSYYRMLQDYMVGRGTTVVLHTRERFMAF